jgi:general secretion pathway protein G
MSNVDNIQDETLDQRDIIESIKTLSKPRGMTLVEVLIVLTIMASIMGVVGVFAIGAIDTANIKKAQIEIGNLSGFVERYLVQSTPPRLPDSLEDLTAGPIPITKKVPKDPWGNDYIYERINNREFNIYSAGPDGQVGTEDDVRKPE